MELHARTETWRPIPGWSRYEACYETGASRNRLTGKVLKPLPVANSRGEVYYRVHLFRRDASGRTEDKFLLIHRLVALTYHECPGNPEDYDVDHNPDRNTANNAGGNVRWATRSENTAYTWQPGGGRYEDRIIIEEEAPF